MFCHFIVLVLYPIVLPLSLLCCPCVLLCCPCLVLSCVLFCRKVIGWKDNCIPY